MLTASVSQDVARNWTRITPFFNTRRTSAERIYTTNSVESLNRSLRKIIKPAADSPTKRRR